MKSNIYISNKLLIIIYSFLIITVSLYNLPNLNQIYVLHDEFGYWANAAYFAGHNWSGLSSISPYYGYGYSFLIAPLFWIFDDPTVIYHAAICLNAFFYVCSFITSYKCGRILFDKLNTYVLSSICLITALYCNNLLQVNIAWSEPLLYLMFWITLWMLLKYNYSGRLRYLLLFAVSLSYLYMIHQRALGVLIAGILAITFAFFTKQNDISVKKYALFICTLFGILILAFFIKEHLLNNLWLWDSSQSGIAASNDYKGQLNKIIHIISSFDSIKEFIFSFIGKVYYLLVSSVLLIFWGILKCIRQFSFKKPTKINSSYFFLLLSLLFAIGINAIFCTFMNRVDGIVYGRYTEYVIGPFLLLGLGLLYESKEKWRYCIVGIIVLSACGLILRPSLNIPGRYNYMMSVGTNLFYDLDILSFRPVRCLVFSVLFAVFLYLISRLKKKSLYLLGITALVVYWFLSSHTALTNGINYFQKYIEDTTVISDAIQGIDEQTPIYYIQNPNVGEANFRIEHIQFLLPDKKIQLIDSKDLSNIQGDYFLIQCGTDNLDMSQYTIVTQAYQLILMVPDSFTKQDKLNTYIAQNFAFTDTMMYCDTNPNNEHEFIANHQKGFLYYRQNLSLNAGTYQVTTKINIENISEDTIGYVDISSDYGKNIIHRQEINAYEYTSSDDEITIVYTFNCKELEHAEMRFYSYGVADLELETVSYKKLSDKSL